MAPLVLRLPRVEESPDPKFVLLHVSQDGSKPLDLKLIGTESSEVFTLSFKQNKTSALRAKNSKSSQEEWDSVLRFVLLDELPEEDVPTTLFEGVEAVTEVEEGTALTITVQKRIEGITQRLGQIILKYTEDEELDLYEWCSLSIESRTVFKQQAQKVKSSVTTREEEIQKLEATLTELTKLKNQNEDALLEKFSLLLNEKKLKIRDQQKLLASATVDPTKAAEMDLETEDVAPGPSRSRKRKAPAQKVVESDSDEAFEKMDVDKPPKSQAQAQAQEEESDSDKADEVTASETGSDSDSAPAPTRSQKPLSPPRTKSQASQGGQTSRKKDRSLSPPSRRTRGKTAEPEPAPEKAETEAKEVKIPPRRELPFAKKPPAKTKASSPVAGTGSETESDDEL